MYKYRGYATTKYLSRAVYIWTSTISGISYVSAMTKPPKYEKTYIDIPFSDDLKNGGFRICNDTLIIPSVLNNDAQILLVDDMINKKVRYQGYDWDMILDLNWVY